jgi:hypothetical protein
MAVLMCVHAHAARERTGRDAGQKRAGKCQLAHSIKQRYFDACTGLREVR